MLKLFVVVLLIVAVSVALLSVRLFMGRGFVKTHVSQSKAMRSRGVTCVQSQDAAARAVRRHSVKQGK